MFADHVPALTELGVQLSERFSREWGDAALTGDTFFFGEA
jgi:hypothetical protein